MPSPVTSAEFVDLLYRSELFEAPRLDSLLGGLRQTGRWPEDAKELAQQLVADGVITYFQASQLMKGRYRGFTLGKYKVLESIGSGGMANVYLCEHHSLRQRVAVKVVPIDKLRGGSFLGRFQREARAVAALQHPNIVRAYDLEADQQYHYLVMEFIDGVNLQRLVKRRGPLSTARAVNYLCQAAAALQYLVEQNIVHRDIKPSNLMLDRRGCIKLIDFGLTRLLDDDDNLTQQFDANRVLGTVDYLAPEQAIKTHDADIRADIFGLGVTGYFILTGATPHQVAGMQNWSDADKLMHQQSTAAKPLTYHRKDLPPGLVAVIHKMMAQDPADRYQTPAEVLAALAPWYREVPPPSEEEIPVLSLAARAVTTQPSASGTWTRPALQSGDSSSVVRQQARAKAELPRTPKVGDLRVQTHWPPDTPSNASLVTHPEHRPLPSGFEVVVAEQQQGGTVSWTSALFISLAVAAAVGAAITLLVFLLM